MNEPRHFLAVAAADTVARASQGGYLEVNGGKAGPLERMRIRNKSHWGASLRFGFLALPSADFARIAAALEAAQAAGGAANG